MDAPVPTHTAESTKAVCPDACETDRYSSSLTYSMISSNQLRMSLTKEKRENITRNREKAAAERGKVIGNGNGSGSAGGPGTSPAATEMQYYK